MERILTVAAGDYLAESLVLASLALIWFPAFKAVKLLRASKKLADLVDQLKSPALAGMSETAAREAKEASKEFDRADFAMLAVGFLCGAASSVMKLFWLIPSSHIH
ncbi:hypothetical protein QCE62_06795 [Caballeronia sp. LZ033]|uniref:hypothetical protein n=1 Tax=Caballeronia sp. LZ033 TaxID=3038566 RepID=UPI002863C6EB|nr:hypothetical protein [Caballeronia sp. LZ033]MDR5813298.1 hypothetical protein [Caballeronia sp. LZ033]